VNVHARFVGTQTHEQADGCEAKEKRPQSAYFLFCDAQRAEAKSSGAEKPLSAKDLGEKWKQMSEEDKEPFITKAAGLKAEYDAKKGPTEAEKKKVHGKEGCGSRRVLSRVLGPAPDTSTPRPTL
jgi:hypothetical protein